MRSLCFVRSPSSPDASFRAINERLPSTPCVATHAPERGVQVIFDHHNRLTPDGRDSSKADRQSATDRNAISGVWSPHSADQVTNETGGLAFDPTDIDHILERGQRTGQAMFTGESKKFG
jgi:hypothetical protein